MPDALADDAVLLTAHPFEAGAMGRVLVAVPGADVRLRPATPDAPPGVRLYARRADGDAADAARAYMGKAGLTVRPDAGTVRVQMDGRRQRLAGWWPWRLRQTTRLLVAVHLPDGCTADVRTLGGRLDARGLRGRHTLEASGGAVTVRDLGGRLEMEARAATLDVRGVRGKALVLHAAAGEAHVADVEAEALTLAFADADTTLADLRGALTLTAHASRTRLRGLRGALTATLRGGTFEAVLDAGGPTAPLAIRAAATPVALTLAASAAATLALRGTPVTLDAPSFAGTRRPGRVRGPLGPGGPPLTIHAAAAPVHCRVR